MACLSFWVSHGAPNTTTCWVALGEREFDPSLLLHKGDGKLGAWCVNVQSAPEGCPFLVHGCKGPFHLSFFLVAAFWYAVAITGIEICRGWGWGWNYSNERSIEISPSHWSVYLKNYYSNYILWAWVIFLFLKKYFNLPISFSTFPFGVVWLHGEMRQLVTWKYLTKHQIPQLWHTCGPHIWT